MNLRQIEAFRSVMRLGSMTAAAEVLYTSQPNVSRLIAQLELSTGLVLFKRAGVRLIPTQQGQALFQEHSQPGHWPLAGRCGALHRDERAAPCAQGLHRHTA